MQESVKHFLWHRDRQMAQFGGGEERPPVAAALVPGSRCRCHLTRCRFP